VIWFLGIDPGATGGFAVLDGDGRLTDVVALPTFGPETDSGALAALLEAVAPVDDLFVGVESPFANNRASSISQLNQGIGFGQILGVLGALRIRHERIRPQEWKSTMGCPMGPKLTAAKKKAASRRIAGELWPDMAHHWAKTSQDGLAEAALIGEATRRRTTTN
jgi:hypothetical protein